MNNSDKKRIIAMNDNQYIITEDDSTTMNDIFNKVMVMDKNGKILVDSIPIGSLLKFDSWQITDIPLSTVYKERKFKTEDALIGFAVGDALGVPVEFLPKEDVRKVNIQEMEGMDGPRKIRSRWGSLIPMGAWSDDTSMLISSMDSIIQNNGVINERDIMNKFMDWILKGKYCSIDKPFGLGGTVMKALQAYRHGAEPEKCGGTDVQDNGNGALMRILPFSLYAIYSEMNEHDIAEFIGKASSLTHGHDISKMSCFIYTMYLKYIIFTKNPVLAFDKIDSIDYLKYFSKEAVDAHSKILEGGFKFIGDKDIRGSGYVIDTLESVLYSALNGTNYEDTVKIAINTGYDTDTIGGITGSIAGALYGRENIPKRWIDKLKKEKELTELSNSYDIVLNDIKKKADCKIKMNQ